MFSNFHKRSQSEKLCIFANSICVFGICLLIGVFANSRVVVDPQSKRSPRYREVKSDRDLILSFDLENQLKSFIFVLMATVGNSMEIPWLMIPWLGQTACQMIQQSFDQFYHSSNPYFLISYTLNGIVIRAMWLRMLILFLGKLTVYVRKKTDTPVVVVQERELEIK